MGVKRGTYKTKKQLLQNQCKAKGIDVAVRWGTRELQAALDGKRPSADAAKANKNRPSPPSLSMPSVCTCGKPVKPTEAAKGEQRRDVRMRAKTEHHHWDGVVFCRYQCECGQNLIVRVPVKTRSIKCGCNRPAVLWNAEGIGTCAHCATK